MTVKGSEGKVMFEGKEVAGIVSWSLEIARPPKQKLSKRILYLARTVRSAAKGIRIALRYLIVGRLEWTSYARGRLVR